MKEETSPSMNKLYGRVSRNSRKRMRKVCSSVLVLAVSTTTAAVLSSFPAVSAFPGTVASQRPRTAGISDYEIAQRTRISPAIQDLYRPIEEEEEDDDETLDMSGYFELQKSTGPDVLDTDLQRQIDDASSRPHSFLDNHVRDATNMEKIAMSSITEQLPRPVVEAFSDPNKFKYNLNFAGNRVSPEEEMELARIIQKGVALEKARKDAEEREGRDLTKQEWAELAGISTRELRRLISNYRRAKQELVTANIGLVHTVVNQQWHAYKSKGISKEELVQEGSLGLLRAAELFDPERGLRFSTYAVVWIKGTLSNSHLPELVRLPSREKTKWNKIVQAEKDIEMSGSVATVEELSSITGLPIHEIVSTQRKMRQAQSVMSLDFEYSSQSRSGSETSTVDNLFQRDKNFQEDADLAERTQMQADVIAALARNLDVREARLLRLRYGLSDGVTRSLQECADAMGVSRSRAQQLATRCLEKLREAAEVESLEEYLLTVA